MRHLRALDKELLAVYAARTPCQGVSNHTGQWKCTTILPKQCKSTTTFLFILYVIQQCQYEDTNLHYTLHLLSVPIRLCT